MVSGDGPPVLVNATCMMVSRKFWSENRWRTFFNLRSKDSLETVIDDDLGLFFAWAAKARVRPEPGKARVHGVRELRAREK
jgi:hypothetical protein